MNEAAVYGILCRQLAVIMRANVSPLSALQICRDQMENRKLKKLVDGLVKDLSGGDKLSDAMKQHEDRFPMIVIAAVEGAERNGEWEKMLLCLAEYFEAEARLTTGARRAAVLPSLMAVICLVLFSLVILQVVPRFLDLFNGITFELPGLTQHVLTVSTLAREYGGYIILGVAGILIIWILFTLSRPGRNFNAMIRMKLPLSGPVNRNLLYAQFSKALSTLLKTGMPMTEAVRVIEDTVGNNEKVRGELQRSAERVAQGMSLSKAMADSSVFSPMILQMTAIGEESGTLTDILDDMADYFDRTMMLLAHRKEVVLETFFLALLGAVMCVVLAAMAQPMMEFYDMVSGM
ncbi:MAG: type II secretion system F family protein [Lachnospiraceae bacterium]|nr:type II secretion system F family protein [Lachnospiraceae bacterium]